MARSGTGKLILNSPPNKNLFFDLEKDPLEMNNLYEAREYQREIKKMEAALSAWSCKEAKPKVHIDKSAPQIQQPNVPSKDLSHREAIEKYYRRKMDELQRQ